MISLNYDKNCYKTPCPKVDCRNKDKCCGGLKYIFLPTALGDDSKDSNISPKNGDYCDAIVVYEANGHIYIYSKEGVPTLITSGGGGDYDEIIEKIQKDLDGVEDDLTQEIVIREGMDEVLQDNIDAVAQALEDFKNSPDVVDIVDTYADLQSYNTSGLTDKDIIRVITDETKDGLSSYYRWNSPNPGWNFIGVIPSGDGVKELSTADYNYPTANPDRVALWLLDNGLYTAPAGVMVAASTTSYPWYNTSDKTILVGGSNTVKGIYTFLNGKVDVVTTQTSDGVEADEYTLLKSTQVLQTTGQSSTDIMSQKSITDALDDKADDINFTGTDGTMAGTAGLVPAPATTDVDKFLKSDGTWDTAGGGGGGGDTVYSDKTTSNSSDGGAVYIGPLNVNQEELPDPTTTDNNYRYFWALPFDTSGNNNFGEPNNESINIGGKNAGSYSTLIGYRNNGQNTSNNIGIGWQVDVGGFGNNIAIGNSATSSNSNAIALGRQAQTGANSSVALGAFANTTRVGEVNIGTTSSAYGYSSTYYRVLGGLYDGQQTHDAVTVNQVNSVIDNLNSALNTNIPHIGAN